MTYLELVKRAAKYTGTIDQRTIASVDSVGRIGTLADTVSEAWVAIQNMYEAWRFLRVEFPSTSVLAEGAAAFTAGSLNLPNWSTWIAGGERGTVPLSIWPAGDDNQDRERELTGTDYRYFRRLYQSGSNVDRAGQPQVFSVDTADRLVVWPTPDEDYRISGTYRRAAQVLENDGDVPIIEEAYQNVIFWSAVVLFDQVDEADMNAVLLAEKREAARMDDLKRRYLPVLDGYVYRPLGRGRTSAIRSRSTLSPTVLE